jgi:hypothetical protein
VNGRWNHDDNSGATVSALGMEARSSLELHRFQIQPQGELGKEINSALTFSTSSTIPTGPPQSRRRRREGIPNSP